MSLPICRSSALTARQWQFRGKRYGSTDYNVDPLMQVAVNGFSKGTWDIGSQQDIVLNRRSPGINAASSQPGLVTYWSTGDQVGTANLDLSEGGYPTWKSELSPFGQELDSGATSNRYKFTGKERDAESGLDYFGARYYASGVGRFISPDWSSHANPVPYAKLGDPQTFNLYSYVQNNPLSRSDNDGHETQTYPGNPSYAQQQWNDTHISHTEMKVWAAMGLTAAAASGGAELAALGRGLLTAATSFCLFHCGEAAEHLANAAAPPATPSYFSMGSWVAESTVGRSAQAIAYEQQITGNSGKAFLVNGVRFDGVNANGLVEAKGLGYDKLLKTSFSKQVADSLVNQAENQIKAAKGTPITWNVAEQGTAQTLRALFLRNNLKGISVVHTPPK